MIKLAKWMNVQHFVHCFDRVIDSFLRRPLSNRKSETRRSELTKQVII